MTAATLGTRTHTLNTKSGDVPEIVARVAITLIRVWYGQWPAYLICQETFGSLTPRRFSCFSRGISMFVLQIVKIEKCITGGVEQMLHLLNFNLEILLVSALDLNRSYYITPYVGRGFGRL